MGASPHRRWVEAAGDHGAGLAAPNRRASGVDPVVVPPDRGAHRVANVIAFLSSDEGGWITGQVVDVSGGTVLGVPALSH